MNKIIPLLDLKKEYRPLKDKILKRVEKIFDEMRLYLGENVQQFEREFAEYCGVNYAVGVGSGTEAIHLALYAASVKPGDEVITVSHTFIATVSPIVLVGAKPVFVDIDLQTYLMDTSQIESKISDKTKAILPVHLYGQACDMDEILSIAKKYNLKVIEDCAQSHGAKYKNKNTGTFGDLSAFSFVFTKNLKAYGDAGIVITNNKNMYEYLKQFRDIGRASKYEHSIWGLNCRLDEVQAAILRVKLPYIDEWTNKRRENAKYYTEKLKGIPLVTPLEKANNKHVYHQYVIKTESRDKIQKYLKEKGIETGIHYPIPVHLQNAARNLGYHSGDLPVTEEVSKKILSIPVYPELEINEKEYIVETIRRFFRR